MVTLGKQKNQSVGSIDLSLDRSSHLDRKKKGCQVCRSSEKSTSCVGFVVRVCQAQLTRFSQQNGKRGERMRGTQSFRRRSFFFSFFQFPKREGEVEEKMAFRAKPKERMKRR
jgi:hypothetical protein